MCLHMQKAKKEQLKTNDKTAATLHKSGMASENLKTSDETITQVKDGKREPRCLTCTVSPGKFKDRKLSWYKGYLIIFDVIPNINR